jgi:hypothetical protein
VAHVILEDIQRDVSDGLDDLPVSQPDRTGTREVRVRDFATLDDDAAREFEDGVGPGVARSRASRIVDFCLIQSDFLSDRSVCA